MKKNNSPLQTTTPKVIIVGAGLQGLSIALALAHHNIPSTILEKNSHAMRAASYGNEGKIHLGFVYAMDETLKTGRKMLLGALSFSHLLEKWAGSFNWDRFKTSPFLYGVMQDSLVNEAYLKTYYTKLSQEVSTTLNQLNIPYEYLKENLTPFFYEKLPPAEQIFKFNPEKLSSYILTNEKSIDTRLFSIDLLEKIKQIPMITLKCDHELVHAKETHQGYMLRVQTKEHVYEEQADIVINCAWYNRTKLDDMIIPSQKLHTEKYSYRIKHRVLAKPNIDTRLKHPITMVQGPYGDVVPFSDGTVYLSWYPQCRTYIDHLPPSIKDTPLKEIEEIGHNCIHAISEILPELKNSTMIECSPCIIVAKAEQKSEEIHDINHPKSDLHQRSQAGPICYKKWWSVDTGKLTLAPYYANETVKQIIASI
jgi:hypothetical protein